MSIIVLENFKRYVRNKLHEDREAEEIMSKHHSLTKRQIKILSLLRENPYKLLNVSLCVKIYEVTKATAIKDLKGLLHLGFVETERRGKNVYYRPTSKIATIFKS
ncbi:MAG: transcriptional regulator [Rickettsiales bacterium]|nr:transcriptional regulator [Rickettsiales bacterium]